VIASFCGRQLVAEETMSKLNPREPNRIERCAVLAAVKPASRPLRRWPAARLDRRSARRTPKMQTGAKKRLSNRTKKLKQPKKELVPTKIA
jgi:hypothetical protein